MSNLVENQAVDLYVLERAFASTHPSSERLYAKVRPWDEFSDHGTRAHGLRRFSQVLEAYADGIGEKKWKIVGGRLDEGEVARFCPPGGFASLTLVPDAKSALTR
jgi:TP53 regulating kinase-like protein